MIFNEKILYVINNKSKSSNETDNIFVSVSIGYVQS